MNIDDRIAQFIEDTRDEDGAQSFVWLKGRGVLVSLDACTDPVLVDAADEWLALEIDRLNAVFRRVKRMEQYGAAQPLTDGALER